MSVRMSGSHMSAFEMGLKSVKSQALKKEAMLEQVLVHCIQLAQGLDSRKAVNK